MSKKNNKVDEKGKNVNQANATECENCKCENKKEQCCEAEKCEDKSNEYLQMAQRLQAEFDNYRKRSADIVKNARIDGIVEAVTKMLPAIDSIEKAKAMITDEKVLQGVEMIEKDLKQSLKNLHIEEIDVLNKPLDPNVANVIAVTNDNSLDDGVVTQVYQAGYKLNDRVLRYAQVVVNKIN
ncbi:MAG: nucleotide exchange factor GrpE [Firmicutes bacterium]|nr:nucleotide exchange factor GrpE [Bacillota bacterium]